MWDATMRMRIHESWCFRQKISIYVTSSARVSKKHQVRVIMHEQLNDVHIYIYIYIYIHMCPVSDVLESFRWCFALPRFDLFIGPERQHPFHRSLAVLSCAWKLAAKREDLNGTTRYQNWLVVWNSFYFPIYWVANHPN